MTKQDLIRANLKPNGIFNLRHIEQNTGLRKYKLYEFVNGKTKLNDQEASAILLFIKNSTKIKK